MNRLTVAVLLGKCPYTLVENSRRITYLEKWVELFSAGRTAELSRHERTKKFSAAIAWLEAELARRFV